MEAFGILGFIFAGTDFAKIITLEKQIKESDSLKEKQHQMINRFIN